MNEVLNNPMVLDIINKLGVTLNYGMTEYVRYTMLSGLILAIVGSILGLITTSVSCWLFKKAYEMRDDDTEPPYSIFGVLVSVVGVLPSSIMVFNGLLGWLCPIGSVLNEVIK